MWMNASEIVKKMNQGAFDKAFLSLYEGRASEQQQRYLTAIDCFERDFGTGRDIALVSAPGRTEVVGNHTDHQHGRVLAAGINLDVLAVASKNDEGVIRIHSEGYPTDEVRVDDLAVRAEEQNRAVSLIRGIASRFRQLGMPMGGFDAYTTSDVVKGSGLSSSAAFETLVGNICNVFYARETISPIQIAQIGQYAENVYFGKPCGLMDQMASSVGGLVLIDFQDPVAPVVTKLAVDFTKYGHRICIVDTGGSHEDLTGEYAAVPVEMRAAAEVFDKQVLREVNPEDFYRNLSRVRAACGDRAVLRAQHFFAENERVARGAAALEAGDFSSFKKIVIDSGHSSFMYLQNVYACGNYTEQGLSLGLALSEHLLDGRGAWRVHGGGFAGTIQCFVPEDLLDAFQAGMESVFGVECCHILSIRQAGGVVIRPEQEVRGNG